MPRMMVRDKGDRFWYDAQNRLHREDGPAVEFDDEVVVHERSSSRITGAVGPSGRLLRYRY